jgi:hypothetical protein
MKKKTARSERKDILEPLMGCFPLGYRFSRFAAVRQVRLARGAGKIDLLVVTDEPSILLIEAKFRTSRDAKDKVVGQLMLYLAHLDKCGAAKISSAFHNALAYRRPHDNGLWDGIEPSVTEIDGWIRAATAPEQQKGRVRAIIALDEWKPDADEARLGLAVNYLADRGISISVLTKIETGEFVSPRPLADPSISSSSPRSKNPLR